MARGGKGSRVAPGLKGLPPVGSRPRGNPTPVPQGKGPDSFTKGRSALTQMGPQTVGGNGSSTINSTPAKKGS